ncbi:hypothetical protein [Erwinia psidii]|uniref:hypothetical protein n=1 Tax=Erwinia psidii TaxID=69224 RepID=UPI0013155BB0|nr:hypothetical protein [Erwinia psidii]
MAAITNFPRCAGSSGCLLVAFFGLSVAPVKAPQTTEFQINAMDIANAVILFNQ